MAVDSEARRYTLALERRITQLEQALAAQATADGPDQLQPNVLTVNPDGTIGANLTGHLKAQGVDLPAGTTQSPPSDDRVRWLRASDGALVASIFGYDSGGGPGYVASLRAQHAGNGAAVAQLATALANGNFSNSLTVEQIAGGVGRILLGVNDGAGGLLTKLLLDGTLASNFVQWLSSRRVRVNAGGDTVHFAASQHAQKVVAHSLGATPAVTLATANGAGAANCLMQYLARDATNITFDAFDPTAVRTGDSNFDWLAIAFD